MSRICSRLALAVTVCALTSCRGEPAAAPTPDPAGAEPGRHPLMPPTDAQTLKEHMREHFAAISELQRMIARGHLDDAKRLATWLGDHDEPMPADWQPQIDELHVAARAVAVAPDLAIAASHAARLGRACSKCHEIHNATVTFSWEPPPDEAADLPSQMKRHQWAAARLWEGLVGPSDELWKEGSSVLATAQLDAVQAAKGVARGDIAALAAHLRELADRAGKVTDHDARAALYGDLLSTCSGCHELVRPAPVPGP